MKKVVILGSTGSIGTQSLDVIEQWQDRFEVVGLSAYRNVDLLIEQAERFHPEHVAIMDPSLAHKALCLKEKGIKIHEGLEGLNFLATLPPADTVIVATVGAIGLRPTLSAIQQGKDIALANKEVLVMAGELMMREVQRCGATLLPIDSEHSAILQCLVGGQKKEVRRVMITASGGPYREKSIEQMQQTSVAEALNHPTWNMGPKITIDSATMMNKGLEVIECYHLFCVPLDQIEVVVHPQSVIHSMIEFVDGSVIAQLASTDMRVPIQYALSYPDRLPTSTEFLEFAKIAQLTFEAPDLDRFPCLRLAYEACRQGGTSPAVLSVANEVAVEAFLRGKIQFIQIPEVIERAVNENGCIQDANLDTILNVENETRIKLQEKLL